MQSAGACSACHVDQAGATFALVGLAFLVALSLPLVMKWQELRSAWQQTRAERQDEPTAQPGMERSRSMVMPMAGAGEEGENACSSSSGVHAAGSQERHRDSTSGPTHFTKKVSLGFIGSTNGTSSAATALSLPPTLVTALSDMAKMILAFADSLQQGLKVKLRVLLLALQIINNWTISFYLKYPFLLHDEVVHQYHQVTQKLVQLTWLFTFDIGQVSPTPLRCTLGEEVEFTIYMAALPVLLFTNMLSAIAVANFVGSTLPMKRAQVGNIMAPILFWATYLTYATLTTQVFQHLPIRGATLDCALEAERTLQGYKGCRFRQAYGMTEESPEYHVISIVAILGALLFVAGTPLSYFLFMWYHRKQIGVKRKESETMKEWATRRTETMEFDSGFFQLSSFQSLFAHLKPNCWYFEVVNICRQLLLTGVLIIFETSVTVHIYLSFLIMFCYALLVLWLEPYSSDSDTRSNALCSAAVCLMFVSQLAVLPVEGPSLRDPQSRELEATVLATVVGVVFGMVFTYLGRSSMQAITHGLASKLMLMKSRSKLLGWAQEALVEPTVEPLLKDSGLDWSDIKPLLGELDNIGDIQDIISRDFLFSLAEKFKPLAKKLLAAKLRPKLEPLLKAKGLSWHDFLEALDGFEKFQEAIADPEKFVMPFLQLALARAVAKLLRPQLEPWLKDKGLPWDDFLKALDSFKKFQEAMADPVQFQEAMADPEKFIMPFMQLALHRAAAKLRPQLEPLLQGKFLEWSDITLLIDRLTSIENVEETIADPDSLLSLLRLAARLAAKAHLCLNLEPLLQEQGLEWCDVLSSIEKLDCIDDLQEATAHPDDFLATLVRESHALSLKCALAKLRPQLEPLLLEQSLTWSDLVPPTDETSNEIPDDEGFQGATENRSRYFASFAERSQEVFAEKCPKLAARLRELEPWLLQEQGPECDRQKPPSRDVYLRVKDTL
ncbi:unnamed protein product [Polarella glacialis]|uniref:Uncharacterized protein n=1 Tax=Polarella glacialis TaxID=89957 RepID=A0A813JYL4_POLGL|nr:unnamed protein product [Polarella glacialis]